MTDLEFKKLIEYHSPGILCLIYKKDVDCTILVNMPRKVLLQESKSTFRLEFPTQFVATSATSVWCNLNHGFFLDGRGLDHWYVPSADKWSMLKDLALSQRT